MQRYMLKSKLHRVTLTGCELHYEGSISVDTNLLEQADLLPGEQVHVLNLSNGERFVTYTIPAPAGSGTIMLNGPAARLGMPGDKLIVISYCLVDEPDTRCHHPQIVHVDDHNMPVKK